MNRIVSKVIQTNESAEIKGEMESVVVLSERDWNGIQETLYLDFIPGMADSIIKGMRATKEDCCIEEELEW